MFHRGIDGVACGQIFARYRFSFAEKGDPGRLTKIACAIKVSAGSSLEHPRPRERDHAHSFSQFDARAGRHSRE